MGGNDYYLVTLDFYEYLEAQKKVRPTSNSGGRVLQEAERMVG